MSGFNLVEEEPPKILPNPAFKDRTQYLIDEFVKESSPVDRQLVELIILILDELGFWVSGHHPANSGRFYMDPDFFLRLFASHFFDDYGEKDIVKRLRKILECMEESGCTEAMS